MSRPPHVPDKGDVIMSMVAQRLGLSVEEFAARRPELERRGFPEPDVTTGRYCIEAVDRWRLRRHSPLFPELTTASTAVDAAAVFAERLGRVDG
jgi:hypothetical protein